MVIYKIEPHKKNESDRADWFLAQDADWTFLGAEEFVWFKIAQVRDMQHTTVKFIHTVCQIQ